MLAGENLYDFYDNSARADVGQKRSVLNDWHDELPRSDGLELRSRMAKSTSQFHAGESELAVHEIFRRQNFKITVHPSLASSRHVDFLIERSDQAVLVEVTTLVEANDATAAANRLAPITNAINKLRLMAGHSLLFACEPGETSPSIKRILQEIEEWTARASPVSVGEVVKNRICEQDWVFDLSIVNSGSEKIYSRAISGEFSGASWISPDDDLKAKLERKSRRYGDLDKPFLIVVSDSRQFSVDDEDIEEALYGASGFFGAPNRPQNQRVSAVLILPSYPCWSALKTDKVPILHHHPFATMPIDGAFFPFATYVPAANGQPAAADRPTLRQLTLG